MEIDNITLAGRRMSLECVKCHCKFILCLTNECSPHSVKKCKKDDFLCYSCGKSEKDEKEKRLKELEAPKVSNADPTSCPICEKDYDLSLHILHEHHMTFGFYYRCHVCGITFDDDPLAEHYITRLENHLFSALHASNLTRYENTKENKESQELKLSQESKESQKSKESQQSQESKESQTSKESQESQRSQESQESVVIIAENLK